LNLILIGTREAKKQPKSSVNEVLHLKLASCAIRSNGAGDIGFLHRIIDKLCERLEVRNLDNGDLHRVTTVEPSRKVPLHGKLELITAFGICSNLNSTGDTSIDIGSIDLLILLDTELELIDLQGEVDLRGRPFLLIGLSELIIQRGGEVILTAVKGASEVMSAPGADKPRILGSVISTGKVLDIENKVTVERRTRKATELKCEGKVHAYSDIRLQ